MTDLERGPTCEVFLRARPFLRLEQRAPEDLGARLDHYNDCRPRTALGGLAPMTVFVNNVAENHT